ncbi:MAG: nucleoporin [Deltaproteobacteria bacterium]|nr:nucleoporin [Deltaproteobacteria bacterium]
MAQIYVMVPGKDQPQLLEIDEVVRRIKAGELPPTSNVARLGETTWSPAKDLPEVKDKLGEPSTSAALPATSTSFPSIPGAPSQAGAPSPLGSQAGAPSPFGASPSQAGAPSPFGAAPSAGGKGGVPKVAIIGGGVALGVIVLGVIGLMLYRNSYSRGLVLEHLPEDCAELYYVDIAGIVTSDPVRSNLEKGLKNAKDLAEDEVSNKSKKDKERFEKALAALEKNGVQPTSIRELAFCVPPRDPDDKGFGNDYSKMLLVVGGTFRKGDVLQGIKEAVETAVKDEDACKLEDDDGLRMLKCTAELKGSKNEPVYGTLVDSRVLAISPDKKTVKSVRKAKDRSKTYGADKGEHVVIYRAKEAPSYDGAYGESKLKIGSSDTVLTVETHYDPEKGKKKLEQFKDGEELVKKKEKYFKSAADKCFDKTPYDMLAESVERTKIESFDDGLRYEYKVSNKDLGKVFKVLADADKEDMSKLGGAWFCVMSTVEPYVANY